MARLFQLTIHNLKKIEVEMFQEEDSELVVIQGARFASEKMFDQPFMHTLHERLNSTILVTSIPQKGCFFATRYQGDEAHMQRFKLVTETQFTDAGSHAFSKSLFVIVNGEVRGMIE